MTFVLPTDPSMDPDNPSVDVPAIYFGRRDKPYRPDPRLIDAANAALTLGMPLLVTGDPGSGKTDFAFAVARYFAEAKHGRTWDPQKPDLLECYIRSDTRAKDLLYSYDVVARFGDAYLRVREQEEARRDQPEANGDNVRAEDPRNYIQLEPLGMALVDRRRRVALVDEIDKAPRDLPNDLLRELDQGWFEIGEIQGEDDEERCDRRYGQPLHREMGERNRPLDDRPFVVITSNAERQLPDPFLRRCVFFHLEFPKPGQLVIILRDHLGGGGLSSSGGGAWIPSAVQIFETLRHRKHGLVKKPSASELLNWGTMIGTGNARDQQIVQAVAEKTRKGLEVRWAMLPHLGCLVKLRADLATLGVLRA